MSSTKRRGDRDYIKKRGRMYAVRFQYPEPLRESAMDLYGVDTWPKERQWSLETDDELEARRRAQKAITEHLDLLAFHQARHSDEHMADLDYEYEMEPDTQERKADGTLIVASAATITTIHPNSRVESRPNLKRPILKYTLAAMRLPVVQQAVQERQRLEGLVYVDHDLEMIERYLDGRFGERDPESGKRPKPDKGDIGLVQYVLKAWKDRFKGKLLKDAARAEVAMFIKDEIDSRAEEDNPLAGLERTKKMVKLLIAAINMDKKDTANTRFEHNPFADPDWSIYDKDYTPQNKPLPFSEADIRTIKTNAHVFTREEYTMVAMHCAMSVRPVGLHSIVRDEWVEEDEYDNDADLVASHRTRCVYIETDKDKHYGKRRLPLPQCLLDAKWIDGTPLLPEKIKGTIFPTAPADLNRQVNDKLRDIGVANENKRLYSGRHRARQRLNSCKDADIRKYIMGQAHARDSHNLYGGYRAYEIKPWIDIIQF